MSAAAVIRKQITQLEDQLAGLRMALVAVEGISAAPVCKGASVAPAGKAVSATPRTNFLIVCPELLPFIKNITDFNRLTLEEKEPVMAAIQLVKNRDDVPLANISNKTAGGTVFPKNLKGKSRAIELMTMHTTLEIYDRNGNITDKWIRLPVASETTASEDAASVAGSEDV